MATKSIKATGGDYSTIQGWEDAETAAGSVGEIQDSSTYAENVTVSGGSGTRKLTVSSANRHALDKTGAVIDPTSAGHCFTVSEDDFTCEHLRLTGTVATSDEGFRCNNDGITIAWCYFHEFDNNNDQDAIHIQDGISSMDVYGCVFVDISRGGVFVQGSYATTITVNVTNCTGVNCGANTATPVGSFGGDDKVANQDYLKVTMVVTNCAGHTLDADPDAEDFEAGDDNVTNPLSWGASNYNASTDVSSPGANSVDSMTLASQYVSVTSGAEDVHLKSGNSLADAGTDKAGVLTVDAEGHDFKVGAWNIGADANDILAAVGLATEQEIGLGIGRAKVLASGLASEQDVGPSLTSSKALAAGLAAEADLGLSVTATMSYPVGLTSEQDVGFSVVWARTLHPGLALETDLGLATTFARALSAGLATETDLGPAVGRLKTRTLGSGTEQELALSVTHSRSLGAGLATEQAVGLAVTAVKTLVAGLALEGDLALGVTHSRVLRPGLTTETDVALAIVRLKTRALVVATETGLGFGVTWSRSLTPGLASEQDIALGVGGAKAVSLGVGIEQDLSFPVSSATLVPVGIATEQDAGFALSWSRALSAGLALEQDLGLGITRLKARQLGLATEQALALGISPLRAYAVAQSMETDLGFGVTWLRSFTPGPALLATAELLRTEYVLADAPGAVMVESDRLNDVGISISEDAIIIYNVG